MMAISEAAPIALTADEIARYRADGVLVLKKVFDDFEAIMWRKAWERLSRSDGHDSKITRKDRFVCGELPPPIGDIYRAPGLATIARQLIGPDVALYMNRMVVKDERWNGPVAAHQDMPYFHGSTQKLSIFVPLGPFNRATGGMSFVLGSHHYGQMGVRGTIDMTAYPHLPHLTVDAEPGDIILMDFLVWHYSEAALVPSVRPVIQIVYQAASDGSYYGEAHGVARPTLVCGEWKTKHFMRYGEHVTADA